MHAGNNSPGWSPTCRVSEDGFEFLILLHPRLECWDYKPVPPTRIHCQLLQAQGVG